MGGQSPTARAEEWALFFPNDPGCTSGIVQRGITASATATTSYIGPLAPHTIDAESIQLSIVDCAP
jgi:hypothetical protein